MTQIDQIEREGRESVNYLTTWNFPDSTILPCLSRSWKI